MAWAAAEQPLVDVLSKVLGMHLGAMFDFLALVLGGYRTPRNEKPSVLKGLQLVFFAIEAGGPGTTFGSHLGSSWAVRTSKLAPKVLEF